MSLRFASRRVVRVRRVFRRRAALTAIILGGALALFWIPALCLIGGLAAFVGAIVLVRELTEPIDVSSHTGGTRGEIAFDRSVLHVTSEETTDRVPLARIAQGWSLPGVTTETVILEIEGGDAYAIDVESEDDAEAVLEAAGVSAGRKLVKTRIAPASATKLAGALVVVFSIAMTPLAADFVAQSMGLYGPERHTPWAGLAGVALLLAFIIELALPPMLIVGVDGIWTKTLFRKRFLPFSKIVELRPTEEGALLTTDDGNVFLRGLSRGSQADRWRAHTAIYTILKRALLANKKLHVEAAVAHQLDRGGDDFVTWKARVARVAKTATYREGAVSVEELDDVLADAQAPAERRIAAAIALRRDNAEAEAPIRAAADATADDDLRAALEAVADEELTEELTLRAVARDSVGRTA